MNITKGYRTVVVNVIMFGLSFVPGVETALGPEGVKAVILLVNLALRCITTTAIGKSI